MKKSIQIFSAVLLFIFLSACGTGGQSDSSKDKPSGSNESTEDSYLEDDFDEGDFDDEISATSAPQDGNKESRAVQKDEVTKVISSSAARLGEIDSTKKLIRKAEIKFRTQNVVNSTYAIEGITNHFDGYISYTHLESSVERVETTKISEDSIIESTFYTVQNNMTIRVPVENLDTMLKSLVILIDFMDYRTITAEDVTLRLMRKELERKRNELYILRVNNAAANTPSSLNQQIYAAESQLEKQIKTDEAEIEMLGIFDEIEYSTITLQMYGREKIKHEVLANDKNIDSYKPGFGKKIVQALSFGLKILSNIFLVIITLWPLLLLGAITWFIIRYFRKKKSK